MLEHTGLFWNHRTLDRTMRCYFSSCSAFRNVNLQNSIQMLQRFNWVICKNDGEFHISQFTQDKLQPQMAPTCKLHPQLHVSLCRTVVHEVEGWEMGAHLAVRGLSAGDWRHKTRLRATSQHKGGQVCYFTIKGQKTMKDVTVQLINKPQH